MKLAIFVIVFIIYPSYVIAQTCDYKVEILVDVEEFDKEDFKWRMRATKIEGKSTNITGTAEIEDSNGKPVKSYKPWTSDSISKQKTSSEYSPNLKPGNYEITAEISVECDDTNKDNNVDTKEIKIKGEIEETKSKKSRNEEEAIDKNIQSERQQQIASSTENTITTKTKKSVTNEIVDNTIELKSQNPQKIQEAQPITVNAIQNPQNTETVYVSSNEMARGWIMIFLLTLSILLNIVLIWRR